MLEEVKHIDDSKGICTSESRPASQYGNADHDGEAYESSHDTEILPGMTKLIDSFFDSLFGLRRKSYECIILLG